MHNLLQKMEAELNRLHQQSVQISSRLDLPAQLCTDMLDELTVKKNRLKVLISKYAQLQAEFMELTGAYSIY